MPSPAAKYAIQYTAEAKAIHTGHTGQLFFADINEAVNNHTRNRADSDRAAGTQLLSPDTAYQAIRFYLPLPSSG
jgi:hypothetical protein